MAKKKLDNTFLSYYEYALPKCFRFVCILSKMYLKTNGLKLHATCNQITCTTFNLNICFWSNVLWPQCST